MAGGGERFCVVVIAEIQLSNARGLRRKATVSVFSLCCVLLTLCVAYGRACAFTSCYLQAFLFCALATCDFALPRT